MSEGKERVVLVTGAGSGIGRAVARLFGGEGSFVYLAGRRSNVLEETAESIRVAGGHARAIPCDVSDEGQAMSLMDQIRQEKGGLEVLVNAASQFSIGLVHETSEEDFDAIFKTNVKGVWLMSRLAIPLMEGRENANIINISSMAGARTDPGMGVYEASKAAVNTLTKVMAKELATHRIRVNAIAPGPVDTELYSGSIFGEDSTRRRSEAGMGDTVPFGRSGSPEEVAHLAVYLASPESDFISGSITGIEGALGY